MCAQVAELVDALVSGISGLTAVEVRVFSWAPKIFKKQMTKDLLLLCEADNSRLLQMM